MTLLQDRVAVAAARFFHSISLENEQEAAVDSFENQAVIIISDKSKQTRKAWLVDTIVEGRALKPAHIRRRILFATFKGCPLSFASIIPFHEDTIESVLQDSPFIGESRADIIVQKTTAALTATTQSFGYLLTSSSSSSSASSSTSSSASSSSTYVCSTDNEADTTYNPVFLDDPALKTGKHRTVIALPSFLGSITHYITQSELKREINDQFRQRHPDIHPSLTLSQIRTLKQQLLDVALATNMELSTVAKSYAYFEKLLLAGKVIKANRRMIGGCCLLLAAKVNDSRSLGYGVLKKLLSERLRLRDPHSLSRCEFAVFAALKFALHLPQSEYMPHFERIIGSLEYDNFQEYLGEQMFRVWSRHARHATIPDEPEEIEEYE